MSDASPPGLGELDDSAFQRRYALRAQLGAGTSGAVALCHDRHIGRDVAVKVLRRDADDAGSQRSRFVREARVQGRLEHPGVPPVHELGEVGDGRPWFTMRVVRGETLAGMLAREADAALQRPRLLAALARVCRTLDFAHAQGVVHRDLSPANVMLGEYGEVHVLDWGLAKPFGEARTPAPSDEESGEPSLTRPGTALGTPGYLAPEQALGDVDVEPMADVYALGAILFEVLTGKPLHPGETARERLESAMRGLDPAARARALGSELPPELADVVRRATEPSPDLRLRSAGELALAIERFLDGDRDLAERQRVASALVASARDALARGGDEARSDAMRALGRAIALVPSDRDATTMLSALLLEPAGEPGPGVRARIAAWAEDAWRITARTEALRYVFWCSLLPIWFVMGVRDALLGSLLVGALLAMTLAMVLAASGMLRGLRGAVAGFLLSTLAIALFTQVLSPIVIAPTLMATNLLAYSANAPPRLRWAAIAISVAGMAVPIALEASGVLAPTFEVRGDAILVRSRVVELAPQITYWLLAAGATLTVAVPAVAVGRLRDGLVRAQRALVHQSWHLEQLLPRSARGGGTSA